MNSLRSAATRWLQRLAQNPKTTFFGLLRIFGSIWYMRTHPESLTAMQLMHPETLVPIGILLSGIESLYAADAKDELKPSEVRSDTTLIGEKK